MTTEIITKVSKKYSHKIKKLVPIDLLKSCKIIVNLTTIGQKKSFQNVKEMLNAPCEPIIPNGEKSETSIDYPSFDKILNKHKHKKVFYTHPKIFSYNFYGEEDNQCIYRLDYDKEENHIKAMVCLDKRPILKISEDLGCVFETWYEREMPLKYFPRDQYYDDFFTKSVKTFSRGNDTTITFLWVQRDYSKIRKHVENGTADSDAIPTFHIYYQLNKPF